MHNNVFVPKYTFRSLIDVLLLSLGLLIVSMLRIWREGFTLQAISLLFIFVIFCFWWMRILIRSIIFTHNKFHVKRYLLPTRTIEYTEVIDFGASKIKTQNGDITIAGMSNDKELINQFVDLIKSKKINENQIEMKLLDEEKIFKKSFVPILILSIPFIALLFYIWPFYSYWFSNLGTGILSGLIFYIVQLIFQRVQRKDLKKK